MACFKCHTMSDPTRPYQKYPHSPVVMMCERCRRIDERDTAKRDIERLRAIRTAKLLGTPTGR